MPFKAKSEQDSASVSLESSSKPSRSFLVHHFRFLILAGALGLISPGCAHESGMVKPRPSSASAKPDDIKNESKPSADRNFKPAKPYRCEDDFKVGTGEFITCCLWYWQCELATNFNDDEATDEKLAMR